MQRNTHNIDATDQVLGRLATQIALLLRGKNKPTFSPHLDEGDIVVIKNVDKIKITGNKLNQKIYYRHSTYPGGLKKTTMREVVAKKGYQEVLKKAVWGMLPKNKLKDKMIKRLKFE